MSQKNRRKDRQYKYDRFLSYGFGLYMETSDCASGLSCEDYCWAMYLADRYNIFLK